MGEDRGGDRLQAIAVGVTVALIVFLALASALGRTFFAVVEGRSMEPILHTGDVVILEKEGPGEIHVGDVVVYKRGHSYIIHRVVHTYKHGGHYCYVVWGDNRRTNVYPDPGDPARCGMVRFRDPYTGEPVVASGIPYDWIVGVVVSLHGSVVKLPYLGALSLILHG